MGKIGHTWKSLKKTELLPQIMQQSKALYKKEFNERTHKVFHCSWAEPHDPMWYWPQVFDHDGTMWHIGRVVDVSVPNRL